MGNCSDGCCPQIAQRSNIRVDFEEDSSQDDDDNDDNDPYIMSTNFQSFSEFLECIRDENNQYSLKKFAL